MQNDFFPRRKKNVDLTQQTAPAELFLIVPIYLPQAAIPYPSHTLLYLLRSREPCGSWRLWQLRWDTYNTWFFKPGMWVVLGPSWALLRRTWAAVGESTAWHLTTPCTKQHVYSCLHTLYSHTGALWARLTSCPSQILMCFVFFPEAGLWHAFRKGDSSSSWKIPRDTESLASPGKLLRCLITFSARRLSLIVRLNLSDFQFQALGLWVGDWKIPHMQRTVRHACRQKSFVSFSSTWINFVSLFWTFSTASPSQSGIEPNSTWQGGVHGDVCFVSLFPHGIASVLSVTALCPEVYLPGYILGHSSLEQSL